MPSISFGLQDDEFWTAPNRADETAVAEARDKAFEGLLLEGPSAVDLSRRGSLDLIGLRRCSNEDNYYKVFAWHAVVAAVSQETNLAWAATIFEDKSDGAENRDRPAPEDGIRKGWSTSPFSIDVRDRLKSLPWNAGTFAFTVFLFDGQSNTAPVRFFYPQIQDPEVAAHLKAKLKPGYPKPIHPLQASGSGHSFEKLLSSPPTPAQGIALKIERVVVHSRDGKCMVQGAFRLPALPGELVRPRPAPGSETEIPTGTPWSDVGDGKAKAVIPVTLLLTGDRATGPWVLPLQVPVHGDPVQGSYEGWFNINLAALPGGFGLPQTYVARALHGTGVSDPVKFSVVTQAMLPKQ